MHRASTKMLELRVVTFLEKKFQGAKKIQTHYTMGNSRSETQRKYAQRSLCFAKEKETEI